MSLVVTIVIGVVSGVVSGIAAWLLMYRAFAPRLVWGAELTKWPRPPGMPERWRYALHLRNAGSRRAVAVTVRVRARVPMPLDGGDIPAWNKYIFEIPTDSAYVPLIYPMRTLLGRTRKGSRYAVVLRFAEINQTDLAYASFPEAVKQRVRDGTVELEELMAHGLQLRFWASGYDETTGAMKVTPSPWISDPGQIRLAVPSVTPGGSA